MRLAVGPDNEDRAVLDVSDIDVTFDVYTESVRKRLWAVFLDALGEL